MDAFEGEEVGGGHARELSGSLVPEGGGAGVPASQACLNGGKGLWLLVAGDRSREGGVPGEEERLVDMGSWRCPVAAW